VWRSVEPWFSTGSLLLLIYRWGLTEPSLVNVVIGEGLFSFARRRPIRVLVDHDSGSFKGVEQPAPAQRIERAGFDQGHPIEWQVVGLSKCFDSLTEAVVDARWSWRAGELR
jgi:hypothetical protein